MSLVTITLLLVRPHRQAGHPADRSVIDQREVVTFATQLLPASRIKTAVAFVVRHVSHTCHLALVDVPSVSLLLCWQVRFRTRTKKR
jgi:hypothetical protein